MPPHPPGVVLNCSCDGFYIREEGILNGAKCRRHRLFLEVLSWSISHNYGRRAHTGLYASRYDRPKRFPSRVGPNDLTFSGQTLRIWVERCRKVIRRLLASIGCRRRLIALKLLLLGLHHWPTAAMKRTGMVNQVVSPEWSGGNRFWLTMKSRCEFSPSDWLTNEEEDAFCCFIICCFFSTRWISPVSPVYRGNRVKCFIFWL